jgi:PLP dependent protein
VGLTDIGENRVEELTLKRAELQERDALRAPAARWHMIGHVQSRKAKHVVGLAELVHSVDSVGLAEKLGRAAAEAARILDVLVQVNTSGEASKEGFPVEEAEDAVPRIAQIPGLRVQGLMTMAPLTDDERVLSGTFARLRELRGRLASRTERFGSELSMGMTNDLAVAVREGSTMVRIGTALFGERR